MKAVAYLRVSSEEQSLERQYDDIKRFAELKSLDLVKIFDDKISGSKTDASDRKGFNEMERYLDENSDIKNILFLEISRLGRRFADMVVTVEKYITKGVNTHIKDLGQSTLNDDGSKSFSGNMIISMLGLMAENEARLLSERVKSGKMSRARKNKAFGGKIIGYKKGEDGTPVIDNNQAPIVKRIFELASQDNGMRTISSIIESEFGRKLGTGTIDGIIKNSFHKGERKYNDITLEVPAIVSEELWQKANDSVKSRHKFGSRANVHINILQGKILCGECGSIMHQKVIPQARLNQFVCKNDDCRNSINRPWLFRMVRLAVERHGQRTKEEQVRQEYETKIQNNKSIIESNEKEINVHEKRKTRSRMLFLDELSTREEYLNDREIADLSIDKLKAKNKEIKKEISLLESSLNGSMEYFSDDLKLFKNEIKDIIKEVIIHKDRVLINIFGWRTYDLHKPNSQKLAWMTRNLEKGIPLNEELPLRHPIDDEQLEMMIDNEIKNISSK